MTCFGTLDRNSAICNNCKMKAGCRAYQLSDGLEITAGTIDALVEALPNKDYIRAGGVRALVEQLINPHVAGLTPSGFVRPTQTQGSVNFNNI